MPYGSPGNEVPLSQFWKVSLCKNQVPEFSTRSLDTASCLLLKSAVEIHFNILSRFSMSLVIISDSDYLGVHSTKEHVEVNMR